MKEAARAVIECGFDQMELESISAFTKMKNLASRRLLEKLNFTPTNELLEDNTKFVLLKSDFDEQ